MTDAIKAALDAAVDAYDHARVASHGGVPARDGMSDANKATIRPMIASAVEAFLRALPVSVPVPCGLANAVQRAGGGDAA